MQLAKSTYKNKIVVAVGHSLAAGMITFGALKYDCIGIGFDSPGVGPKIENEFAASQNWQNIYLIQSASNPVNRNNKDLSYAPDNIIRLEGLSKFSAEGREQLRDTMLQNESPALPAYLLSELANYHALAPIYTYLNQNPTLLEQFHLLESIFPVAADVPPQTHGNLVQEAPHSRSKQGTVIPSLRNYYNQKRGFFGSLEFPSASQPHVTKYRNPIAERQPLPNFMDGINSHNTRLSPLNLKWDIVHDNGNMVASTFFKVDGRALDRLIRSTSLEDLAVMAQQSSSYNNPIMSSPSVVGYDNQREAPSIRDNLKISDVGVGTGIGGGTALLISFAGGGLISIGTGGGVSGTGYTIGWSVALGPEASGMLLSSFMIALPIAACLFVVGNILDRNKKRTKRKIKHNGQRTQNDMEDISNRRELLLDDLFKKFEGGDISENQFAAEVKVLNEELLTKVDKLDERANYAYHHGQREGIFDYIGNKQVLNQLVADNNQLVTRSKEFSTATKNAEKCSKLPISNQVDRIQYLAGKKDLTFAEYNEAILISNGLKKTISHSASLLDLKYLDILMGLSIKKPIIMTDIPKPEGLRTHVLKHNDKYHKRKYAKADLDKALQDLDNAYRKFKSDVETSLDIDIDKAKAEFFSVFNESKKILQGIPCDLHGSCYEFYLRLYLMPIEDAVNQGVDACIDRNNPINHLILFDGNSVRLIKLAVSLRVFGNCNKLLESSDSDEDKQLLYKESFAAALIIDSLSLNEQDVSTLQIAGATEKEITDGIEMVKKSHHDSGGSYLIDRSIKDYNALVKAGKLNEALTIAKNILQLNPPEHTKVYFVDQVPILEHNIDIEEYNNFVGSGDYVGAREYIEAVVNEKPDSKLASVLQPYIRPLDIKILSDDFYDAINILKNPNASEEDKKAANVKMQTAGKGLNSLNIKRSDYPGTDAEFYDFIFAIKSIKIDEHIRACPQFKVINCTAMA